MSYQVSALLAQLDKTKNSCILDLGCGNGYLVNLLVDHGYNAFGTDASEKGIAIAKKRYPDRFFVQDLSIDELPHGLSAMPFDTIISTEVIEHLYDPEQFIRFCGKNLPPGWRIDHNYALPWLPQKLNAECVKQMGRAPEPFVAGRAYKALVQKYADTGAQ